jgi:Fe-S cluster assembly ATP-binding protein
VLITHTTRLLRQIPVEYVHVMWQGRIVAEGGPELAETIEADGYEQFTGAGVAG